METNRPQANEGGFDPSRREFLGVAVAALAGAAAVSLIGCGTDLSGPGGTVPPTGSALGSVGLPDHPGAEHVAFVTPAQMNAGGAATVHIQGYADHDHLVVLSSSQVAILRGGTRGAVAVTSTQTNSDVYGFHDHRVSF